MTGARLLWLTGRMQRVAQGNDPAQAVDTLRTNNPHVIVTRGTKADRRAASEAYMSHLLDPCGLPPKTLRTTRLADLVNTIDPKLVAAAFGMRPEGAIIYLADHLDDGRLPDQLAEP